MSELCVCQLVVGSSAPKLPKTKNHLNLKQNLGLWDAGESQVVFKERSSVTSVTAVNTLTSVELWLLEVKVNGFISSNYLDFVRCWKVLHTKTLISKINCTSRLLSPSFSLFAISCFCHLLDLLWSEAKLFSVCFRCYIPIRAWESSESSAGRLPS